MTRRKIPPTGEVAVPPAPTRPFNLNAHTVDVHGCPAPRGASSQLSAVLGGSQSELFDNGHHPVRPPDVVEMCRTVNLWSSSSSQVARAAMAKIHGCCLLALLFMLLLTLVACASGSGESSRQAPRDVDLTGLSLGGTWCEKYIAPALQNMQLPAGTSLSGDYVTNIPGGEVDSSYPNAVGKCYVGFNTAPEGTTSGDQRIVIFGQGDLRDEWSSKPNVYPDSFVYAGGMTFASTYPVTVGANFSPAQINSAARAAAIMHALVDWRQ